MPRQKLIHIHTSLEKEPSASNIEYGEIAVQYPESDPCLYIKDAEDNIVKFIPESKIDEKIEDGIIDCGWYAEQQHNYVDLGLPSGTLWATENIKDANGNEMYFAWGETQGYTSGQVGTDKYFAWTGDNADYKYGTFNDSDQENWGMEKYNKTDGKTVLDADDDAATANWGSSWKMPTKEQFQELKNYTEHEWTTVSGVQGSKLTSTVEGHTDKFLFFPAVGNADNGEIENGSVGDHGCYWSVSLGGRNSVYEAWVFYSLDVECVVSINSRYYGYSVRPVHSQNL